VIMSLFCGIVAGERCGEDVLVVLWSDVVVAVWYGCWMDCDDCVGNQIVIT